MADLRFVFGSATSLGCCRKIQLGNASHTSLAFGIGTRLKPISTTNPSYPSFLGVHKAAPSPILFQTYRSSCVLPKLTAMADQPQGISQTTSSVAEDKVLKFATFLTENGESMVGVIRGDKIWPLHDAVDLEAGFDNSQVMDMLGVIHHWHFLQGRISLKGTGIQLSMVKLQAPIPRPNGAVMCIGKNYVDHVKEVDTWKTSPGIANPDVPKHPIVFTKAPQSVIGPGAIIKYPHGVSSQLDYEAELAVIIGKAGQGIKREEAMSYVFGYTILNDVTARDLQKRHQQWFLGKSCDTFCPMGPWIVLAPDIDGQDVQIQCWVNSELRQNGRTSQLIFSIPELIETISSCITIQPGDIIATGTPSGVGSGFDPPKHLVPGDVVKIRIEGIGELQNQVQ